MMLSNMKTGVLAAAFVTSAAQADALPPLASDRFVHDQLLAGFIGDQIDKNCDEIGARKLTAIRKLYWLRNYARDKGYSDAQIKAFVDDKAEKAKFVAEATAYLAAKGATPENAAAYCEVGLAEISARSLTGHLLFSK